MKSIEFVANGILIQDCRQGSESPGKETCFKGLGAFPPWPLTLGISSAADEIVSRCDELFMRYDPQGNFALHVLPNSKLVSLYLDACRELSISTAILLCYSPNRFPTYRDANELRDKSRFLGYDYGSRSCDYSSVYDDLFGASIPGLECRDLLNENGLFSTTNELYAYCLARRAVVSDGKVEIEEDSDCCPFQLYDCSDAFTLA